MNTLLILGTIEDPQVKWVVSEIKKREDIPVVVIDYLRDSLFSIEVDSAGDVALTVDGQQLVIANAVIWDCVKLMPGTPFYLKDNDDYSGYAAEEWRAFYKLICALGGDRTLNSLSSRVCMIKPYQQAVASSVGLLVPETLITNNKNDVKRFSEDSPDGVIMKSLSSCKVRPPSDGEPIYYNIMTMRVSGRDIDDATQEEIAYCPHFFQNEILKDYELRVVCVDGVVLSYKIDSQVYKTSEVDWRHGFGLVDFSLFEIDAVLKSRVQRFMNRMGLFSGSLDFIVDRQGRHWFLECNQQGAWGWLNDLNGDNVITRAFVDALIKRVLGEA